MALESMSPIDKLNVTCGIQLMRAKFPGSVGGGLFGVSGALLQLTEI
jgi:hypothetical protein